MPSGDGSRRIARPVKGVRRAASEVPRSFVPLLATAFLVDAAMYSVLTPLLPDLVDKFDLSKAAAGVLYSAYMVGQVLGAIAGGRVVSWVGRRRATQLGLLVLALSLVAFPFAEGFHLALFFRTVSGLASGVVWVAAMTWMLAAGTVARRGEMVGTVMSISIVGTLVGPVIGNAALVFGQALVFLLVGVVSIVCAAFLPADRDPQRVEGPVRRSVRPLDRTRLSILSGSMWVMAVSAFIYGALFVLLPLDLSARGTSSLEIGWIFAVCSAMSAVVNRWIGKRIDRTGARWATYFSLSGAAALLFGITAAESEVVLIAAICVAVGLVMAIGVTPISAAVSLDADALGLPETTRSMILLLVFAGGEALGSLLAPMVAQGSSDDVVYVALAAVTLGNLAVLRWCSAARHAVSTTEPMVSGANVRQNSDQPIGR